MKFIKIIFLFVFGSAIIVAQSGNEIKLNLEESIKIALENNSDLKQIKLDYDKAKEQVWEAYGTSVFPSIDGSVSYQRAIKQGVINKSELMCKMINLYFFVLKIYYYYILIL